MRIAVLITCYNRAQATLACLSDVNAQNREVGDNLDVVLVDDGSTDGTADLVAHRYPEVRIIKGSGSLFWNGGMRLAFAAALQKDYDYYLLLNDDTSLIPGAIASLVATARQLESSVERPVIVAGSTRDPESGTLSYGGWRQASSWGIRRLVRVDPGEAPVSCDAFNGNVVLVSAKAADLLGNLDPGFTHSMGDLDYGLRARQFRCPVWLAPGFVGECRSNPGRGLWTDVSLPLKERWIRMLGPKGLPPGEWLRFTRRHAGILWPISWINPYLRFWLKAMSTAALQRKPGP